MSTTQVISKGDLACFTSKVNKCKFVYSEIRATVQAPLRDSVNVGLQILQSLQFLMQQKTLKSQVKRRQSYKWNGKYNNNNNNYYYYYYNYNYNNNNRKYVNEVPGNHDVKEPQK